MNELTTIINVIPAPKGRPKITSFGGHARAYTPAKTRKAENEITYAIRQQTMAQGVFDAGAPLSLFAVFYIEKPKSASKKVTMPLKRPDLDNYVKLLLDALNKYVIPDDSQVVDIHVRKRFGNPPRIELRIYEVSE